MNNLLEGYRFFFEDQLKEIEAEQKSLLEKPMSELFRKGDLAFGLVQHINSSRGHIIIKFLSNTAPRLKIPKSITLIKSQAFHELGKSVTSWECSFINFADHLEYYTINSDILPLYYADSSGDCIGCSGVSVELFSFIDELLSKNKKVYALLYTPFPPTEYYDNMMRYLDTHPDNPDLLIKPKISFSDWHPKELSYNPNNETSIADTIMEVLDKKNICILQGPPGTGKTFNVAHIAARYLSEGKKVCVTTMANKGLMELIAQPPLKPFLESGRIRKTNLTEDERRQAKGLLCIDSNLIISPGMLLCATNYVLSRRCIDIDEERPPYDLVIIEEASQAFLVSIVAFKAMGKKCLIVGDPMQLPPIVLNPNKTDYRARHIDILTEGLKTFALGTEIPSYRIISTFRLTQKSAELTATFYSNHFYSVRKEFLDFSAIQSEFFPAEGGVLFYCTHDSSNGTLSDQATRIILDILLKIHKYYPKREIAVIVPFRDSVKTLQRKLLSAFPSDNLTVETVDRIQGMTVDYTILYLPTRNPGFALEERRFNVATSRSRSTTLILSDMPLDPFLQFFPHIRKFLQNCKRITK